MRMRRSRLLIVVGGLVIGLLVAGSVLLAGFLFTPTSYGQNFILQLTERNEDAARDYLTPEFQEIVRVNCPSGSVTACFWAMIPGEWGSITSVQFVARRDDGESELFHLTWDGLDAPVSLVLATRRRQESYLVHGWRGFVVGLDAAGDAALLDGTRVDNALTAE